MTTAPPSAASGGGSRCNISQNRPGLISALATRYGTLPALKARNRSWTVGGDVPCFATLHGKFERAVRACLRVSQVTERYCFRQPDGVPGTQTRRRKALFGPAGRGLCERCNDVTS
jgi:hypothetical protein